MKTVDQSKENYHRFYEDSGGDLLETSNIITEQMVLSEDSNSAALLVESRGLPRVTSSPGPLRFEPSQAEASSFLTQGNKHGTVDEED